jgi:FMN phosphatase YigB (HAD superfamily)/DNA-binding XRE family transcriptional regulator
MAMNEKGLGRRVQRMRQAAGLTQQELCQRAGLSYSTLTKIERGAIKSPSIFTIQNIAATLDVTLDELIEHKPAAKHRTARSKSGISFIYFDINGCLVRFFQGAFVKLAADIGEPSDVVETIFWHYNDRVCRGEITVDEFNQALAKDLHIDNVDWLSYYLDAIEPIPEMHDLVRWAAERYHIGLLTNIMPGFVKIMLDKGLIPDVSYEAIIDSSETGAIKPEAKIYEAAQTQAHCVAGEILLIDDSRANLMAAEKQGWHTSWFDDYHAQEAVEHLHDMLEPIA